MEEVAGVVVEGLVLEVVEVEGENWGRWIRYGRRSVRVVAESCWTAKQDTSYFGYEVEW